MGWVTAAAAGGSNCVEAAPGPARTVRVRNSRDRDTVLEFTRDEFAAFVAGCRDGDFDALTGTTDGAAVTGA